MKNLIGYSKFKKLYEEADATVLADEKTYFANVKGNFAGAETTLIGSNVIRVFNFLKRKYHDKLLRDLSKELYSEYTKGLLRGVIRHGLQFPKPKTEYEAVLIKNANGEKVEEQKKYTVKFKLIDKGDGKFDIFEVGAVVLTTDGNKLEDGIYLISDKYVKIIDSKINSFDENYDNIDDEPDEPVENDFTEDDSTEDDSNDNQEKQTIDKDISEYIDKIKSGFDGIEDGEKQSFYNQNISKIKNIKKIFKEGLEKIEDALVSPNPGLVDRLSGDKLIYEESIKAIDELIEYIKPNIKQGNNNQTVNKRQPVSVNEEIEPMNYSSNKPKIKPKSKINPDTDVDSSKIGDDLMRNINILSQVNIKLDDDEWVRQFDQDDNKQKITNVVLESKPELVKIQLSAEKIYEWGGGVNKKLERYWKNKIEEVKSQFTRFMHVDMVDPIKLKNKLNEQEQNSINKNPTGPMKAIDSAMDKNEREKNQIVKESLKMTKNGFKDQNDGSFGIVKINSEEIVYSINNIDIDNKKHSTYKIIAKLKSNFTEEVSKNPDKTDFEEFLDRGNLPSVFIPKLKSVQVGADVFSYVYTFIISTGQNLATGENNTSGNILYVYAKNKDIIEIDKNNAKNFVFRYLKKNGETEQLKPNAIKTTNDQSKIFMSVQKPFQIVDTYSSNYGLNNKDKKPTLTNLNKLRVEDGGYSLGELKPL